MPNLPDQRKINFFYMIEGMRSKGGCQDELYGKAAPKHVIDRKKTIEELIKPYISGLCLDCGCAEGLFSHFMATQGAKNVLGVDLSRPKIQRAISRKNGANINFYNMDWNDIPKQLGIFRFNLTILCESLEHALDPEKLLNDLFNISKYVFISVPVNETYIDYTMQVNGHLRLYKEKDIRAMHKKRQEFVKVTDYYGYIMLKGNLN